MKILLDENVDNRLKQVLQTKGFKVSTTFEKELSGEPDSEILEYALENQFIVLTHDDDFLALITNRNTYPTIAYLPQRVNFKEMKNRIEELKEETEITGEKIFL